MILPTSLPDLQTQLPELRLKTVLIATDFSPASDRAVFQAVSIARRYGAKLYVVHIVSSMGFTLGGPGALALATEAAWRDMAQLERELSRRRMSQGLTSFFFVCSGEVSEELETIVQREHIDLVVIATNDRKGAGKLLLGSVAEQVFRNSSCPVLTVGPHWAADCERAVPRSDRRLLFATDFGGASLQTLPHAISLANQLGKRLILLHVLSSLPKRGDRRVTAIDADKARGSAHAAAIQRLAKLVSQEATMKDAPAFMVEFDKPAEGILKAAEVLHADMIIMGLPRRTHVETISRLPWSTAYEVVCGAVCPVLTLRY
jgi:nucleotide-binding universal stress UspA family protein